MSVTSLNGYVDKTADAIEYFHGNQLVYIGWDKHLMFCSANAYPFPPDMPFGALVSEVLPGIHGCHPDFENIDWDKVEWTLDGKPLKPDMEKSLKNNGVGHKSLLSFRTPGLDGYKGSGS